MALQTIQFDPTQDALTQRDLTQDALMQYDCRMMRQALHLGRFGLGRTAPNPSVGCVITDADNRLVGSGWTQDGGRPHAETMALAEAGEAARGGMAFVTLEPCAHSGQTPPCAQALIEAGVTRVVYAIDDPDPRVNGGGAAMLRNAGIAVEKGVLAAQAQRDQLGFLLTKREHKARPMVTLKLALSANGFMRTPEGQSPWITGPISRQMGHALRARHDAILIGSGTLAADNPSLDCRLPGLEHVSPVPVIMSRRAIASDRKLAQRKGVLAYTTHDCKIAGETICLERLTPAAVLADLASAKRGRGITRVMLECGPLLARAFLADDLVDELAIFCAPHEIDPHEMDLGGQNDISRMGLDRSRFAETGRQQLGEDSYTHFYRTGDRL